MKHICLFAFTLCTAFVLRSQDDDQFFENFDSYENGDYITVVQPAFQLWNAESADAPVTTDAAASLPNSLEISGTVNGGPLDVILNCGLVGIQEISFKVLVPTGYSGYYNFQGAQIVGQIWSFNCFLNADGTIQYQTDPTDPNSVILDATYNTGEWVELKHQIDTDAGTMNVIVDGECIGELPYVTDLIGSVNFFPVGDASGATPRYYVDDIVVPPMLAELPSCSDISIAPEMVSTELEFWPNPAKDRLQIQANHDKATVRILALNGQVVFEDIRSDLRAGAEIDLELDNGFYLLEVSQNERRATQRLVIQK